MVSSKTMTIILCALLPCVSGCLLLDWLGLPVKRVEGRKMRIAGTDIVVERNVQFPDIPVPLGFALRPDSVFSYRGRTFRFGKFTYEGVWTWRKTSAFYLEQMPQAGWKYVGMKEGDYTETQTYTKGRERCEITITSKVDLVEVFVNLTTVHARNRR